MKARTAVMLVAATLPAACTWQDGQPFATVTATLTPSFQPSADRIVGDGFFKLTNEYQVRIDRFELATAPVQLVQATAPTGSGAVGAFDPARPPPGYSLCHNGHCHADDGRLVDYADIQAELTGGAAGGDAVVMTLVPPGPSNVLAAAPVPLRCVPEDCTLEYGQIARAKTAVTAVLVAGVVRDGLLLPRLPGEVAFSWSYVADSANRALPLSGPLDLPVDNQHEPQVALQVAPRLSAVLFDGIDFAALANEATPITVGGGGTAAAAAAAKLSEQLLAEPLVFSVTRSTRR